MTIAFGPVPSRRLGRSLGVNNIPPKACSYSCLYCQVGATRGQQIRPRDFYTPQEILEAVKAQLAKVEAVGETVDYLTLVPDGEPTLDGRLSETIHLLRTLQRPVAVISNASLLWIKPVREALASADWVSLKVDSVDENTWNKINRPHPQLKLVEIMEGMRLFAAEYQGILVSETMLIEGLNDPEAEVTAVSGFLAELGVSRAYLSIPTRPTARGGIKGPAEGVVNNAYQLMAERLPRVEYLIGYEGDAFAFSGDVRQDLLSISAVHPMRESAVNDLLRRSGSDWSIVDELVEQGSLKLVEYQQHRFVMRRFTK